MSLRAPQYTEGVANQLTLRLLSATAGYCNGPLLMRRDLSPLLDRQNENFGRGWRFFLFGAAQSLGYGIVPVTLDLPYPLEQRGESTERDLLHRMRQLGQNTRGPVLSRELAY